MPAQKTCPEERWNDIWTKPPITYRKLTRDEVARIRAAPSPEVELGRVIQSCPRVLTTALVKDALHKTAEDPE